VLIPFVHQLVPVVDVKAKRMTVIPPEDYEAGVSK
jgi:16S rRNA processing protein RimM